MTGRSIALFVLAALVQIGGAWLVWQGVKECGFRPDRYDLLGALTCLVGVAVIMYAPRAAA